MNYLHSSKIRGILIKLEFLPQSYLYNSWVFVLIKMHKNNKILKVIQKYFCKLSLAEFPFSRKTGDRQTNVHSNVVSDRLFLPNYVWTNISLSVCLLNGNSAKLNLQACTSFISIEKANNS